MEIHDKIRIMREINHWSQEKIAEKLEMSPNGYAKIERGQTHLNLNKLKQIADIFNVKVEELISEENQLFNLSQKPPFSSHLKGNHYSLLELHHLQELLQVKDELLKSKEAEIAVLKENIAFLLQQNNKIMQNLTAILTTEKN